MWHNTFDNQILWFMLFVEFQTTRAKCGGSLRCVQHSSWSCQHSTMFDVSNVCESQVYSASADLRHEWPLIKYPITSHHITSHHITSHHITSHHITYSMYLRSCYCLLLLVQAALASRSLRLDSPTIGWNMKNQNQVRSTDMSNPSQVDLVIRASSGWVTWRRQACETNVMQCNMMRCDAIELLLLCDSATEGCDAICDIMWCNVMRCDAMQVPENLRVKPECKPGEGFVEGSGEGFVGGSGEGFERSGEGFVERSGEGFVEGSEEGFVEGSGEGFVKKSGEGFVDWQRWRFDIYHNSLKAQTMWLCELSSHFFLQFLCQAICTQRTPKGPK